LLAVYKLDSFLDDCLEDDDATLEINIHLHGSNGSELEIGMFSNEPRRFLIINFVFMHSRGKIFCSNVTLGCVLLVLNGKEKVTESKTSTMRFFVALAV
jgi:hypothetical protein